MIALINPPFIDKNTYYYNYITSKYPNPSLAYLGGYLRSKDIAFDVIDAKFYDMSVDQIIERLKEVSPRIIGITSTTSEIEFVHEIIRRIRKNFPKTFIVLGGVHATAMPYETFERNDTLDALVAGEGEFVLEKLAKTSDLKSGMAGIPGIYYRINGKIFNNPPAPYAANMHGYGQAAFDLWKKADRYFVNTYRGCPFPCSFCFRALGKSSRLRDPEDVLSELEYIAVNAPLCELMIVDATFGLEREYTEYILKEAINRGLNANISWRCATRVDTVDREFLELMKEAGCVTVSFGIESGSDRILKATGKQITVAMCIKAVEITKSVGIETVGYYLFGHIGETKEELNDTLKLIWRMNCDNIAVGVMVPWPGTKIFELAIKNQGGYKLLSKDYSKYDKYFGNVMKFENFSMNYLDLMRIKAFVFLYLKNYRFYDLAKFFWDCREQAVIKMKQLVLGR